MADFSEVERRIRDLITVESQLPAELRQIVCSDLDAGEYGLALDDLGDYIVEHELQVGRLFIDDMAKIYGLMGAREPRNIAFLRTQNSHA